MRILVRALVFLGSAALGLLAAALVLDDVEVTASGFVITAVIFAVVQSLATPFLEKLARDKARALLGGVGVFAALIALLVASLVGNALTVTGGPLTWVLAALIVWVVTAIATMLLPAALVKAGVESAGDRHGEPRD